MRLTHASTLVTFVLTLCAGGCGGASSDDGRNGERIDSRKADEDGDAGAATGKGGKNADDGASGDDDGVDDDGDTTGSSDSAGATPQVDAPPASGAPVDAPSGVATGGGAGPVMVRPPMSAPPGIGLPVPGPGASGEPLPPLEDCTTDAQSQSSDYCEVQQSCGEAFVYTSCYFDGVGAYYCNCSRNDAYGSYHLQGVDATTACGVATSLCSGQTTPEYAGEPVCEPAAQSVGTDYCDRQITCTQSADLGDGVSAHVTTDYRYSSCYHVGDGSLSCHCSTAQANQNYTLSGVGVAESCDLVLDLCGSEAPAFDEPATCTQGNAFQETSGTNSYCQLEQSCTQSAELDNGVVAGLTETEWANCETNGELARCSCSSNTGNFRFDLESSAAEACSDAMSICTTDAEIAPEGPLSCMRTNQYAGSGSCNTYYECSQDAVVDGTVVGVYGSYQAYCEGAGDGAWSCTCSSGTEQATIMVTAEDEWSACTDAGELCADAIAVQIGQSGYGGVVVVSSTGGVAVAGPAPRPL